jgi:hypothetical protein
MLGLCWVQIPECVGIAKEIAALVEESGMIVAARRD